MKKQPISTKFKPQSTLSKKQTVRAVPKKRAKDPALFDPSEYAAGKFPMQAWETRKGKQPDWVIQQYGINEGELT
jgi:hypothetical protein